MKYLKNNTKIKIYWISLWRVLFLTLITPLAYLYYENFTLPFLLEQTDISPVVYDSRTYTQLAEAHPDLQEITSTFNTNRNLIGPILLLHLLNNSPIIVLLFNLTIYYISLTILFKTTRLNKLKFFLALTINPLMFSSLTSINKEILSVCSLLIIIAYTNSNLKRYLILSIIISLFARQELTALLIFYATLRNFNSPKVRLYSIIITILIMTALLPTLNTSSVNILMENQKTDSLGLSVFFSKLTSNYAHFLTVIPKIFINMFGDIKLLLTIEPDTFFPLNAISSLQFLITFIFIRKFKISDDTSLLALCYAIIFTSPAFIHHRYFFPVYVVLLAKIFQDKFINTKNTIPPKC